MRSIPSLLLALCLCLTALAQGQTRIRLDLRGLDRRDTLALLWGAINKSMPPLVMQLPASTDTLSLPLSEPRLLLLRLKGAEGQAELLAAPGEDITLSARLHKDHLGKKPRAEFRRLQISGARWQSAYDRIRRDYIYYIDSLATHMEHDLGGVTQTIRDAKRRNDEQAIADLYQTRAGQDYIERVTGNFADRNDHLARLVERHKDNFLGPLILLRYGGRLTARHAPLFDLLAPQAKQSHYGCEVRDEVAPLTLRGCPAPVVTVTDTLGQEQFLNPGGGPHRLLLVNFWASWCTPCLKEIPQLLRLHHTYHAQGLHIVGISADRYPADWRETIQEHDLPWPNYIDLDKQAITEFRVQFVPTLFLVNAQGTIVAEKLRGTDLEDFVKRYFAAE